MTRWTLTHAQVVMLRALLVSSEPLYSGKLSRGQAFSHSTAEALCRKGLIRRAKGTFHITRGPATGTSFHRSLGSYIQGWELTDAGREIVAPSRQA